MESFLIGFFAGTFLAELIEYSRLVFYVLASGAAFVFLILLILKGKLTRIFCFFLLGVLLSLFYFQFFTQKSEPKYISFYNNQTLTLEGKVSNDPEESNGRLKLIIQVPGIHGKVLVNVPQFPHYQYGDRLKIKGKLETPPVFDDFNYREYLRGKGIYSVVNRPEIELVEPAQGFSLKRSLFSIKNRLEETLNRILPEPEASLSAGILLGNKRGLPDWLYEAFIVVGLIHLVALSGYNVTVISKNIAFVFNLIIPKVAFFISLLCIWLFVLMVGAEPTIVRAALMGSLFLLSKRVGRGRGMTRILLLTAFLMVLQNPLILKYDRGFQLSFLATCGLVYLAPILERGMRKWRLAPSLKEVGVSTLSAQIFVLPLLLIGFKKLSLVSLPANLLVLPFIPYTMLFSFLTAVFGLLYLPLGQFFGFFAFLFLKYIVLVAEYLSKIPGAFIKVGGASIAVAMVYWAVLGVLTRLLSKKIKAQ